MCARGMHDSHHIMKLQSAGTQLICRSPSKFNLASSAWDTISLSCVGNRFRLSMFVFYDIDVHS